MQHKVSVILPFYNAEKTLDSAIQSIISQTYPNFELILVNNNSDDNSCEIAQKYVQNYSNLSLYSRGKQGVVYASRLGLEKSKGKYIARMDADDIALPGRLQLQADFLDRNDTIDVVSGIVTYRSFIKKRTDGFERFINWSNSVQSTSEIELNRFVEFPLVNPTLMFRREIPEKYGFYRAGDFPEDYEMFLRWLNNGVKFFKLNIAVLEWRDYASRLTRTDSLYSHEKFYKIKAKYLALWLKNKGIEKIAVWGAGRKTRKRVIFLENEGIEIEFYIDIVENKTTKKKCIHFSELPKAGEVFIVPYVAMQTARQKIEAQLKIRNYILGKHYIFAG